MEENHSLHNFLLSKPHKIRKSFEYRALIKSKKRVNGKHIALNYRFNTSIQMPRLGITVSSKLAKAYIRNKFKRIIREVFRLNKHIMPKNLEINILAGPLNKDLNYSEIEKDFLDLISTITKNC